MVLTSKARYPGSQVSGTHASSMVASRTNRAAYSLFVKPVTGNGRFSLYLSGEIPAVMYRGLVREMYGRVDRVSVISADIPGL